MRNVTFLEAIREALAEEMAADDRVMLIGEDIGRYGGAFKVTAGLFDRFGADRVVDTPIAEAAVIGAAIGAATLGMRPVAELQFFDFVSCAGFDQLVSVAAKMRYRTGVGVPIVVRGPAGGGGRAGPFHSACPEMWLIATPGLKVVFPSTPYDAKGLLKSAIRDPDPVIFLEHKGLYRRIRGDVPDEDYSIALGQAAVRRDGDAGAIITYGATAHLAVEAAQRIEQELGRQLRVIDLRSLVPLDEAAITRAAVETGRVIVAHEHAKRGGIAGEIAAVIHETAFDYLDAPIMRVAAANTPVPPAPTLEDACLPQVDDIVAAAREVLAF